MPTLPPAYCFLLAVSIAEFGAWPRLPPVRRYVAAGLAACGAAILIEVTLYALVPSRALQPGLALGAQYSTLLGRIVWSRQTSD